MSLQPAFVNKEKIIQAGGPSAGNFYANSPTVKVGLSYDETGNEIINSIFTNNNINSEVVYDLLNKVNDSTVWETVGQASTNANTYLSARNFGLYGNQDKWTDAQKGNAQIVLLLLQPVNNQLNDINTFSEQYWQIVYRSINDSQDVITLYMCRRYLTSATPFDSSYGDYSNSDIRQNILSTYNTLAVNNGGIYSEFDNYVVMPSELPGYWQSSEYQSSFNKDFAEWTNGVSHNGQTRLGYGVSGVGANSSHFNIGNGMDGLNDKWVDWENQDTSMYYDKLWLPSAFEVVHTGYNESETLGDTNRNFDNDKPASYVRSQTSVNATITNGGTEYTDYRAGLWELNGYDKSGGGSSWSWLRSGFSNSKNTAAIFDVNGQDVRYSVSSGYYIRPAIHLNLKLLAENSFVNITAESTDKVNCSTITEIPKKNWSQSIPDYYNKFEEMVVKNSQLKEGTAVIKFNFDSSNYKIKNLEFIDKNNPENKQNLFLDGQSGSGNLIGFFDYQYEINNGNVTISVNNVNTNVNIVSNIVSKYQTTFNLLFNSTSKNNFNVIVNVIKGSKDNYSSIQQIVIGREEETNPLTKTISLLLEAEQQYTIVVSKPYTWQVDYEGSGVVIGDCYVFTVTSQSSHTITITSGGIPNIWVSI